VEVEGATSKAVQYLFIGKEAESTIICYCQQVVSNECVNLSQSTRHTVQFGSRNEVIEVARGHTTEKVPLTKLYHRRHLPTDTIVYSLLITLYSTDGSITFHVTTNSQCIAFKIQ